MCQVSYSKTSEYKSANKVREFTGTPKWAFIEITSKCTHKCSWCYGGFNEDIEVDEITVSDFALLVQKLLDIGITQITLSGGEPTDHSDLDGILRLCKPFITNVTSHGDWEDPTNMALLLQHYNVNQVQFNYQGSKHHDSIHKISGSYNRQLEAVRATRECGTEVVGSLTAGSYNLNSVQAIFEELSDMNVSRLRVWETTGFGNHFKKDTETVVIFNKAAEAASKLGYNYTQSYEPLVKGDLHVPCIAMKGMAMHINTKCEHIFCGAVVNQLSNPLSNLLVDDADSILLNYTNFISKHKEDRPFCMSRRG